VPIVTFSRCVNAKAWRADRFKGGQPVLSCFGENSTRFGITSITENGKTGPTSFMGKRHRNLIQRITSWENLQDAYHKTATGKRRTWGYLEFKEYDLANLRALQTELLAGAYKLGPYRCFTVFEPKPRQISALDFKDRLVQHAVCNVIAPIFEAGMLPYSFACRPGKGTHAGVRHVQAELRRTGATHFLKSDFSKYFPSIDHAALYALIEKKINCAATRRLLCEILPPEGKGIPIGSLTSQLFANIYGSAVDNFLHHELKARHWARYMDDIVVLGDDPEELRRLFYRLRDFAAERLHLGISHWQVAPVSRGINFLGYRIWPTHKLLRKASVTRAKRKVSNFLKHGDNDGLQKFLAAWRGHARWADTNNLFNWMENRYGVACH
jgi:retron-type reverse transcriptase